LENVPLFIPYGMIATGCTNGIAIELKTKGCYKVGTKPLWVAEIDTCAMVVDSVLILITTGVLVAILLNGHT